jgi:hypothetical protein
LSVFVFPNEFDIMFRLPMFGDGAYKILPTSVVGPDEARLLRFTSCTLDVRHCFSRYVVNRFFLLLSLSFAQLATWANYV